MLENSPLHHMRKVNEMVQNVLNQEVIQSPWASPIVLVTKKDGTTR